MNPQDERFNEQLERALKESTPGAGQVSNVGASADQQSAVAEDADLLHLARQLQEAPHIRADPVFTVQLEQRMLRHALARRQVRRGWLLAQWRTPHRVLALAMSLCLVLILLGAGALALVARTTHLASPFSSVGHGQPSIQNTSTAAPADLAGADLQTARARLLALQQVATSTQTDAYVQGLANFEAQLARAAASINALPTGDEKTLLITQLAQLKGEARQKLRGWLHTLTPTASAATTSELGRLGESIPQVSSASIVLPAHPRGNATVRVIGSGLQSGARLLVDSKLISITGMLQNGQLVFVLPWTGEKHPHTLGIVNPDGTVAQTSNVGISTASKSNNGNGQGK